MIPMLYTGKDVNAVSLSKAHSIDSNTARHISKCANLNMYVKVQWKLTTVLMSKKASKAPCLFMFVLFTQIDKCLKV